MSCKSLTILRTQRVARGLQERDQAKPVYQRTEIAKSVSTFTSKEEL